MRLLLSMNPPIDAAAAAAKSLQSCLTLCNPIDGNQPGSPVPGILQARTLEWVAISFSSAWKWKVKVKSLSGCLTLLESMDCSLPGFSVHGIFQARVLEWVPLPSLSNWWPSIKSKIFSRFYKILPLLILPPNPSSYLCSSFTDL